MKFEIPEILVAKFAIEDVITVSGPESGENELPGQGGEWD